MKKAYAKLEMEVCRFDLEEHLALGCGNGTKPGHGGAPGHGGGGRGPGHGGGHGKGGMFDTQSVFDTWCAPNGSN